MGCGPPAQWLRCSQPAMNKPCVVLKQEACGMGWGMDLLLDGADAVQCGVDADGAADGTCLRQEARSRV